MEGTTAMVDQTYEFLANAMVRWKTYNRCSVDLTAVPRFMSVSKSTRDLSLPHANTCLPQCRGHRFTDQEVDPDDCVAVKDWWFNTGFHSASDSLSTHSTQQMIVYLHSYGAI
ncbi:hypothetical protein HID58_020707 [Brassica napus]|uniref:Pectin acetylesterase n=1 Tax=Brassica napus TaxID=3708 RepID=A0ABQ8CUH6_BRANA|nr:hypothetical protein HID58_020707 [Brassica napus]